MTRALPSLVNAAVGSQALHFLIGQAFLEQERSKRQRDTSTANNLMHNYCRGGDSCKSATAEPRGNPSSAAGGFKLHLVSPSQKQRDAVPYPYANFLPLNSPAFGCRYFKKRPCVLDYVTAMLSEQFMQ